MPEMASRYAQMPVMEMSTAQEKADRLRQLHRSGSILMLPNAWDAASAKIFEREGFPAVATTSAGIAASMGYADGERIPRDEMLAVVARIVKSVTIPVTVDLEAGYATTPEEMRDTTQQLLLTGAVGMNLEDGLREGGMPLVQTSHHAEKIKVVREVCHVSGIDLVINARTDIFLKCVGDGTNRLAHAIHRGNAYLRAGADCIFVPGVADPETIFELTQQINGPVNVLAVMGTPCIKELQRLGVARVTFGSGAMRATLGLIERIARELRDNGTFENMLGGATSYARTQELFSNDESVRNRDKFFESGH
jgi:2-methylisocitrate lyase-like PEP mutase family enzyme